MAGFERLTDRARKTMALADQEAKRFNCEYVGTEHLLLGILRAGQGNGFSLIDPYSTSLAELILHERLKPGPEMVTMGKLPQTPRAKKVIEYAIEEARSLNHNYVGTEHLVLGMLLEREGIAAQVLIGIGMTVDNTRERLTELLQPS